MKILFLDQSGKPGGAELCLIDIAKPYRQDCLVGLFADGSFRDLLVQNQIPVQILTNQEIQVRKESSFAKGLGSVAQLLPLISKVAKIATNYEIIYANTQKALVIGAFASFLSRRPLVYHLHDILSPEHFSKTNRTIAVTLANRFATLVIANSVASKTAFIEAGGHADITEIVYNGFDSKLYQAPTDIKQLRHELGLEDKFIIGHFSRLSPWKGQHILIDAVFQSDPQVTAILVGDALFGEQDYVKQLHQQVAKLGLENRVKFLGFRNNISQLMSACDLVAHTSTAPEPFGRVIVEAMLCGKPVVASKAGGAMEIVEHGVNGFLVTPNQPQELAEVIDTCVKEVEKTAILASNARTSAIARFDIEVINTIISDLLNRLEGRFSINGDA
jgi:glycosyltransferase involved in cell wall biosynthesis